MYNSLIMGTNSPGFWTSRMIGGLILQVTKLRPSAGIPGYLLQWDIPAAKGNPKVFRDFWPLDFLDQVFLILGCGKSKVRGNLWPITSIQSHPETLLGIFFWATLFRWLSGDFSGFWLLGCHICHDRASHCPPTARSQHKSAEMTIQSGMMI